MFTRVKTPAEIEALRTSGKMLATVLNYLKTKVETGISTKELDAFAAAELKKLGGQPAFLDYQGFPNVLCVSVNDEVVHGIPRADKILNEGDVVGLDFGVNYQGMITDSAISLVVGKSKDTRVKDLIKGTEQALMAAIDVVKDGVRIGDIGAAAQAVMEQYKLGIVKDLVGHGVGHQLHEEPNIPNYGSPGTGPTLKKHMSVAIEPMATLGSYEVTVASDGWTVKTRDHSLSAHFEHTVLIEDGYAEVLTRL